MTICQVRRSLGGSPGFVPPSRLLQGAAHLEDVVSGLEVGDVDPLAVDVMSVRVPAAHRDALVPKVGAFVTLLDAWEEAPGQLDWTLLGSGRVFGPRTLPAGVTDLHRTPSPPDKNWPCDLQPPWFH